MGDRIGVGGGVAVFVCLGLTYSCAFSVSLPARMSFFLSLERGPYPQRLMIHWKSWNLLWISSCPVGRLSGCLEDVNSQKTEDSACCTCHAPWSRVWSPFKIQNPVVFKAFFCCGLLACMAQNSWLELFSDYNLQRLNCDSTDKSYIHKFGHKSVASLAIKFCTISTRWLLQSHDPQMRSPQWSSGRCRLQLPGQARIDGQLDLLSGILGCFWMDRALGMSPTLHSNP